MLKEQYKYSSEDQPDAKDSQIEPKRAPRLKNSLPAEFIGEPDLTWSAFGAV